MRSGLRARAALLTVAVLLLAGCGGSGEDGGSTTAAATTAAGTATAAAPAGPRLEAPFGSMASLPGVLRTGPPWPANDERTLQLRLRAIGLDPLREEGQVLHIHQHLDIYVDGRHVTIPAQIGIDAGGGFISDLHTHDTAGIVHVESPTQRTFTLGQFFAVWGLPLSSSCIGSLCRTATERLRAWVGGTPVTADPTRIVLDEHQEIVLAYGTDAQRPKPVPASFDFAASGL
jgi:hypothetical protein